WKAFFTSYSCFRWSTKSCIREFFVQPTTPLPSAVTKRILAEVTRRMPDTNCRKRIGIDFDNTLIDYDQVFRAFARERGRVGPDFSGGKDELRRAVRALPEGEEAWQRLQGAVYGSGIGGAVMFEGVDTFLRRARAAGHEVLIVSHKTEYGHF